MLEELTLEITSPDYCKYALKCNCITLGTFEFSENLQGVKWEDSKSTQYFPIDNMTTYYSDPLHWEARREALLWALVSTVTPDPGNKETSW